MPNDRFDPRYKPTREDVWIAVGLPDPNPRSGPADPDPFNMSQHPSTEFEIASRIARIRTLPPHSSNEVGRVLQRNRLRELLDEMVTEGMLVGLPRSEWAAMRREPKSRAKDTLYAHPVLVKLWTEMDEARALAAAATEYRLLLPEGGGVEVRAARRPPGQGSGWAVSVMRSGGGPAWTTEGWQEPVSALSVDRLFCWPEATTAIAEIRTALSQPDAGS
jgi:hypothetical protein